MSRVRVCAELRCYAVALPGSNRCAAHPKKGGDTAPYKDARHGYWAKEVLRRCPRCVVCGDVATHADHIIPIVDNASLRFDITNGQGLCQRHHSAKTMGEIQTRRRLSAI